MPHSPATRARESLNTHHLFPPNGGFFNEKIGIKMKKDIKKELRELFDLCLICGVGIVVVFHLNSMLSTSNQASQIDASKNVVSSDTVQTVISKQIQKQKTR